MLGLPEVCWYAEAPQPTPGATGRGAHRTTIAEDKQAVTRCAESMPWLGG
jgi:hypothetical protein